MGNRSVEYTWYFTGNYRFSEYGAEASVSFIRPPTKHSSSVWLHRSLASLYLRQDVCHLWQRIIKFRNPLMAAAGAEIAQRRKVLFITSRKSQALFFCNIFLFFWPTMSSISENAVPLQKFSGPQLVKKKEKNKKNTTILNWWFTNMPALVV